MISYPHSPVSRVGDNLSWIQFSFSYFYPCWFSFVVSTFSLKSFHFLSFEKQSWNFYPYLYLPLYFWCGLSPFFPPPLVWARISHLATALVTSINLMALYGRQGGTFSLVLPRLKLDVTSIRWKTRCFVVLINFFKTFRQKFQFECA